MEIPIDYRSPVPIASTRAQQGQMTRKEIPPAAAEFASERNVRRVSQLWDDLRDGGIHRAIADLADEESPSGWTLDLCTTALGELRSGLQKIRQGKRITKWEYSSIGSVPEIVEFLRTAADPIERGLAAPRGSSSKVLMKKVFGPLEALWSSYPFADLYSRSAPPDAYKRDLLKQWAFQHSDRLHLRSRRRLSLTSPSVVPS